MSELTEIDLRVRHFIVTELAETGRAPMLEDVAMELSLRLDALRAALQRLHEAHLLVLDADGRLLMAHPFSNVPTGFRVTSGGTGYDANCALDALGIPAALNRDCAVTMQVPGEQGKFRCQVRGGVLDAEDALVHFPLPLRQWYDDIVFTCANILLFRSVEAVDEWCAARGVAKGAVVPLAQVWALAQAWYANRLDRDYHGRSATEAEAILASVGLTGPFWRFENEP